MLVEWALDLCDGLVKVIFSILGILPDMPDSITTVVDNFFDLIFSGVNVLNFFVPLDTVAILIPIVIAIVNFDRIYKIVMWILRKIPFLSIE